MHDAEKSDSIQLEESPSRVSLFSDPEITECGLVFEEQAWAEGFRFVAGIDEVGRGCLAGPVVAGACILDPAKPAPQGINDSKLLTEKQREEIEAELKENCIAFAIGEVDADEIDRINILEATKVAMRSAIAALDPSPDFLLIDALQLKGVPLPLKAIIKGDMISASIAAASILAKNYRDRLMKTYAEEFPEYGFSGHVGYATKVHLQALQAHGPCRIHRKTFRGVAPKEDILLAKNPELGINI